MSHNDDVSLLRSVILKKTKKDISNLSTCFIPLHHKHKQKSEPKSERIFEGRFITDEEYQRMTKFKRSDISVLMEEIDKEYEHLKELNK